MAKTTYYEQAKEEHKEVLKGWEVDNAFGVENNNGISSEEVSEILGLPDPDAISSTFTSAGAEYSNIWTGENGVAAAWDGAFDDQEGWENLGDAAAAAALNYVNSLLEKIKKAWTTTTTVSLSSLIGEVAPYCINASQTGKILSRKVGTLMSNIGEWFSDSLITELNNLGDSFLNDPNITAAVSNLKIIQAFASTLNGLSSTLDTTKKIMESVEPFIPWLEIIANLALSVWSGGTTATTAGQQLQEYLVTLTQDLYVRVFEIFRRLIFNISFKAPSFLVMSLSSLKFNEATDISEGDQAEWEASKNSIWGQAVTQTSSVLTGNAYNSLSQRKTVGQTLWGDATNTLSGASDVLKSYGNKIGSGDLLSSFKISKDSNGKWTTTSASEYFKDWTSPVTNYVSDMKDTWGKYNKEYIASAMHDYVSKAQAAAHVWAPSSYSSGNGSKENYKKTKTSVVPGSPRIVLDEIRIMQESNKIILSQQ